MIKNLFLSLGILISLGATAHAEHEICFADINKSTKNTPLKDHDWITVTSARDRRVNGDHVKIVLRLDKKGMWWKGIVLVEKTGSGFKRVVEGEQSKQGVSGYIATIPVSDLSKYHFTLSKAKAFGVHTNMYRVTDAATKMKGGHYYIFTWKQDLVASFAGARNQRSGARANR